MIWKFLLPFIWFQVMMGFKICWYMIWQTCTTARRFVHAYIYNIYVYLWVGEHVYYVYACMYARTHEMFVAFVCVYDLLSALTYIYDIYVLCFSFIRSFIHFISSLCRYRAAHIQPYPHTHTHLNICSMFTWLCVCLAACKCFSICVRVRVKDWYFYRCICCVRCMLWAIECWLAGSSWFANCNLTFTFLWSFAIFTQNQNFTGHFFSAHKAQWFCRFFLLFLSFCFCVCFWVPVDGVESTINTRLNKNAPKMKPFSVIELMRVSLAFHYNYLFTRIRTRL